MDNYYPFTAIVGQEQVKEALLLNAVNKRIGGVLLCGEKGTAKSTIVRAFGDIAKKVVVTLPLNATEDMVVGSIDFEKAVLYGKRAFQEGILKKADQNILYVDEINLLSDSLASIIVETMALGENRVEREGISYVHNSQFLLIGTMNPEEGGLRPQLLDKFGLYVEVAGEQDVLCRAEIIRRRLAYERDTELFCRAYQEQEEKLRIRLINARNLLTKIVIDDQIRQFICQYVIAANTQGNRCELILTETAMALAAWHGRSYLTTEDVKRAAYYVLPHRRKESQKENSNSTDSSKELQKEESEKSKEQKEEQQSLKDQESELSSSNDDTQREETEECLVESEKSKGCGKEQKPSESVWDEVVTGDFTYSVVELPMGHKDRVMRKGSGHRKKTISATNRGRYQNFVFSKTKEQRDLALDATLRAAASNQYQREKNGCAITIEKSDFRYQKKESRVGATIVFVVDASGSMNAEKRMKATKEAILSMLLDSYQKRDKVGLIAFRKKEAKVLLPITTSVDLAKKALQELPTGGRTPLCSGIYTAWQQIIARKRKDSHMLPLIVLITDGRSNVPFWTEDAVEDSQKAAKMVAASKIPMIVIDTEQGFLTFELAKQIALYANGTYFKVGELKTKELCDIVKDYRSQILG